jgi:hypothetical protein
MIAFIDGPDGSGKSTLIAHLHPALAAQGLAVTHAPPLWTYLDELVTPEDFGPWARTTPGIQIAQALLAAMTRRIAWLTTTADTRCRHDVALVDRGPKTVICSALAHLKTGKPPPDNTRLPCLSADQHRAQLERHVRHLAAVEPCMSIELRLPNQPEGLDLIIARLSKSEEPLPPYVRYLDALRTEIAALSWTALPLLPLDANASITLNTETAVARLLNDSFFR